MSAPKPSIGSTKYLSKILTAPRLSISGLMSCKCANTALPSRYLPHSSSGKRSHRAMQTSLLTLCIVSYVVHHKERETYFLSADLISIFDSGCALYILCRNVVKLTG